MSLITECLLDVSHVLGVNVNPCSNLVGPLSPLLRWANRGSDRWCEQFVTIRAKGHQRFRKTVGVEVGEENVSLQAQRGHPPSLSSGDMSAGGQCQPQTLKAWFLWIQRCCQPRVSFPFSWENPNGGRETQDGCPQGRVAPRVTVTKWLSLPSLLLRMARGPVSLGTPLLRPQKVLSSPSVHGPVGLIPAPCCVYKPDVYNPFPRPCLCSFLSLAAFFQPDTMGQTPMYPLWLPSVTSSPKPPIVLPV